MVCPVIAAATRNTRKDIVDKVDNSMIKQGKSK
jgi:hypothetical protein